MTKPEEIREVIDLYVDDECLYTGDDCGLRRGGYCISGDEHYKCLMKRLDGLGLAIKVERELPKNPMDELKLVNAASLMYGKDNFTCTCAYKDIYTTGFLIARDKYAQAGYVAVESLIEPLIEVKDERA